MVKAVMNGTVIAESDRTEIVEGNYYFPPGSIKKEHFKQNNRHTTCPWKGEARYYDIEVNGEESKSEAWFYPNPSEPAKQIKNYIAFYGNKVKITN